MFRNFWLKSLDFITDWEYPVGAEIHSAPLLSIGLTYMKEVTNEVKPNKQNNGAVLPPQ